MYLHEKIVHEFIIEDCTCIRKERTGFPDDLHSKSEKAALDERYIQI